MCGGVTGGVVSVLQFIGRFEVRFYIKDAYSLEAFSLVDY